MSRGSRGFTLMEFLVVAVLGTVVLLAVLQTLIINQRTYAAQGARIQGQQAIRAAADVLFGEIRELSPQGGDLLNMAATAFTVRSMRKFGVVCDVSKASPPVLRVMRVGSWFEDSDSVFVFADNETDVSADDAWIAAQVTAIDTSKACGSSPAQALSFAGQGPLFTADSVRTGAPVRSYVHYTFGLITYGGDSYLGRIDAGGSRVPLVGPLTPSGLRFVYLDSLGAATSYRSDVRQIEVTIRTSSEARNAQGEIVSDSLTTLVFTRN